MQIGTMFLVFVYGTLKTNKPNHFWLEDQENGVSRFIGTGSTNDKYPLVIGTRYNIPFLINVPNVGHSIKGEIYKVDELMLSKLDILEDHPNYYLRQQITINGDDGENYLCWIYFLKKYPEDFLKNRELLSSYENPSDRPYIKPTNRPDTPKPIDDLDYRP